MKKSNSDVDLYRKMIDSEKFFLLGKMASGVAHEINNPIMIIQNYISLILDDVNEKGFLNLTPQSDQYDSLLEIMSECRRVSKITKNLLEFSRTSLKSPQTTDLNSVLVSVLKLVQPMIVKAQVQIKVESQTKNTICMVKPDEIQQVFINIIDNAIYALQMKYPDVNSNLNTRIIEIVIRNETIKENLEEKTYVVIDFLDFGTGISDDVSKRIFDPFFTTKKTKESVPEHEKYQGLGLGLSYCDTILDEYGGFIKFDSELGKYSCFHVYIPVKNSNENIDNEEDPDLITF